jgi:arylsulfatase A-like enzyme
VKRPVRRAIWALLSLVVSTGLIGCGRSDGPPERIILIVVDTLRRDHVSPYGSAAATPNLQRLAADGQVFSNAIASFHQTTMSMAALFTGRTPSLESGDSKHPLPWNGRTWCGMTRFAADPEDGCIPQGLTTLAEDLKRANYWTVGVVSNPFLFRPAGYDQGFDEWIEVAADDPDEIRKVLQKQRSGIRVQTAVDDVLGRVPDRPLFLYVHYMDAHDYDHRNGNYPEAVARADEHVGSLLHRLEAMSLLDAAVVFFTSDHGEILDEKFDGYSTWSHFGNPSFQPVLEIPLIVAPPRFEDTDALIRSQDIADLVRQVAGVEAGADSEPSVARDEHFVGELNFLTYRKGRFKSTFHRNQMGVRALFDLDADSKESVNLIGAEREVSAQHLTRVGELVEMFATSQTGNPELTEEDRARLRALGYLDE